MRMSRRPSNWTASRSTTPSPSARCRCIENGKKIGEVVFTAYTVEGKDRPVTFALNGGPGAASVYLNLGAIGPKHIKFGDEGDSPSDPATLTDNPGHLAGFHRPGVHRPDRHRVQPLAGFGGGDQEAVLLRPRTTSTISRASFTTGW